MEDAFVLVGRSVELASLLGHLEQRRPAAVVGVAGVGKTALLRAAAGGASSYAFEGGALNTLKWMPVSSDRAGAREQTAGQRSPCSR